MSNYLSDRRKALQLTQRDIAVAVGVSESEATVSRWESGIIANMRRDRIAKYADILRTTPHFIMTGEEEPPTKKGIASHRITTEEWRRVRQMRTIDPNLLAAVDKLIF